MSVHGTSGWMSSVSRVRGVGLAPQGQGGESLGTNSRIPDPGGSIKEKYCGGRTACNIVIDSLDIC
jgi:hypothetical protein